MAITNWAWGWDAMTGEMYRIDLDDVTPAEDGGAGSCDHDGCFEFVREHTIHTPGVPAYDEPSLITVREFRSVPMGYMALEAKTTTEWEAADAMRQAAPQYADHISAEGAIK